ncbi:hypothetical protein CLV49_3348 [Labedella gwakjiensis]|uniref:Uncharacterized protein n=1 Tax=Labedella gwakjiensis TaxID=390269 RepID=A0A2P8H0F9_9MICO|nr:hypothetical protein [Labedella gwakjiensis]PSL39703.1 hypothetical protein CLV49_3348 [Labedella gwakjiensis]RUQ85911.1 hypothetical protein ELQ93_02515 [Labedella gwakjiensis]
MTTVAAGTLVDRGTESADGVDLALIRLGRALEAWGIRRAHGAFRREQLIARYSEKRSTAAAIAHSGILPR